jgi:hypothetical protein
VSRPGYYVSRRLEGWDPGLDPLTFDCGHEDQKGKELKVFCFGGRGTGTFLVPE